jgi:transcription termination/antitermination protein NusA
VNELRGEKIDVIRWSPDPSTYIANALSPARVDEVRLVDSEGRQAHILVGEDQLSLAIGKEGQNVRLAARLTGWKLDIKDTAKYDREAEDAKIAVLAEYRAQQALNYPEPEEDEYDEADETDSIPADRAEIGDADALESEPEPAALADASTAEELPLS